MPAFDFVHHDDGCATLVDDAGQVGKHLEDLFLKLGDRSPHYRALMLPLESRDPIDLLGTMPVTDKTTYRTILARESLAGLGSENFVVDLSSGSTARPVSRFCRTVDDLAEQEATERAFRRAGIGRGDRLVFIDVGMAQIYEFYARAARSLGAAEVTYLHLTHDLDAMLAALRELRPNVVLTIPSLLARAEKRLLEVWPTATSPVRCLISTGEPMPARLRAAIKRAWGCSVMSLYGTTETGCLASECSGEDGHHFDVDAHVLTLLQPREVTSDMVEGELLLTTAQMCTQAVVKYAVGDIVRVSLAPCACGEPTPRIWHMRRTQDAFVFAGEKFHHGMIIEALRAVAPDLDSLVLEVEDLPDGPEHVLLRAVIPDDFRSQRFVLLEVLRDRIFELDSLVHAGLVRIEVDCRSSEAQAIKGRKNARVIDRRA